MLKGWLWLFCMNMFRWIPCVPQIRRECYSSIPTAQLKYQVGMWPRTGDLSHNLYPPTHCKAIYIHPLLRVHLKSRNLEYPRCCTHLVKERKFIKEEFPHKKVSITTHAWNYNSHKKGRKDNGRTPQQNGETRRKQRTLEYIWELKKYLFGGRLATRSLAEVCSLPGGLPNPLCTFQCSPTQLHSAFFLAFCI